eukprot:6181090-Pleurochrysis_carterae.AAC.3
MAASIRTESFFCTSRFDPTPHQLARLEPHRFLRPSGSLCDAHRAHHPVRDGRGGAAPLRPVRLWQGCTRRRAPHLPLSAPQLVRPRRQGARVPRNRFNRTGAHAARAHAQSVRAHAQPDPLAHAHSRSGALARPRR